MRCLATHSKGDWQESVPQKSKTYSNHFGARKLRCVINRWYPRVTPTPAVNQCKTRATATAGQLKVPGSKADNANKCTPPRNIMTGQSGKGWAIATDDAFMKSRVNSVNKRG